MNVPDNLKFTKEHEWVRVEDGAVVVGITEFAQSELGEIVFVELPEAGTAVEKSGTLCVVESTKAASDVYAPVAGTVQLSNEALADSPDLVNSEPYEGGWMVRIEGVSDEDLGVLMEAQQYKEFLQE